MNIALDTNAYSDFMRGRDDRVRVVRAARSIALTLIVLSAGFAAGTCESVNAATLQRFLASPRVSILLPDEQTAHHYAHLHLQLRSKGAAIPTNDLWIASLVIEHDLVLCTSDRHFDHLPQLVTC